MLLVNNYKNDNIHIAKLKKTDDYMNILINIEQLKISEQVYFVVFTLLANDKLKH